jgi:Flp pilus assembly protein protease CpaA
VDLLLGIRGESMNVFRWGVVIGASLVAALGDMRHRRIPNALTFPLLIVGLIWAGWSGGFAGLGQAAGACVLLGAPYVLLFVFAGGGAGDAKLMGAIGAWLGLKQSIVVLLCVASVGIVLAVLKAVSQRRLKFVLTNVLISVYTFVVCVAGGRRPKPAGEGTDNDAAQSGALELPYGVAICLGVLAAAAVVWTWGVDWLW